jgi:hypothetical protein
LICKEKSFVGNFKRSGKKALNPEKAKNLAFAPLINKN